MFGLPGAQSASKRPRKAFTLGILLKERMTQLGSQTTDYSTTRFVERVLLSSLVSTNASSGSTSTVTV